MTYMDKTVSAPTFFNNAEPFLKSNYKVFSISDILKEGFVSILVHLVLQREQQFQTSLVLRQTTT